MKFCDVHGDLLVYVVVLYVDAIGIVDAVVQVYLGRIVAWNRAIMDGDGQVDVWEDIGDGVDQRADGRESLLGANVIKNCLAV